MLTSSKLGNLARLPHNAFCKDIRIWVYPFAVQGHITCAPSGLLGPLLIFTMTHSVTAYMSYRLPMCCAGRIPCAASGIPGALADFHDDVRVEPQLPHRECVHHGHGIPAGLLPALCDAGAESGDGRGLDLRPAGDSCRTPVSCSPLSAALPCLEPNRHALLSPPHLSLLGYPDL